MGGDGWLYSLVKKKTQNSPKYKNYLKNCIYFFFCLDRKPPPGLNLHCANIHSCSSSSLLETTKQWLRGDGWTSWQLIWSDQPALPPSWALQVKTWVQTCFWGQKSSQAAMLAHPECRIGPWWKEIHIGPHPFWVSRQSYNKPTPDAVGLIPPGLVRADAPWKRCCRHDSNFPSKIPRTQLQCKLRNKMLARPTVEKQMENTALGTSKNKGWNV